MKPHPNQYSPSKTKQVFFILFCFFYQLSFSQTIDSLENLLSTTVNLEEKIEFYQALILECKEKNPDKAIDYSDKVLKLLSSNKYKQRGKIYQYLGSIYSKTKQYEQAFVFSDSSLYYFERAGLEEEISIAKSEKWKICRSLVYANAYKDFDKAEKYANLSLKMALKSNNLEHIGISYGSVAALYNAKHHMERSIEYFDSSIYYLEQSDNKKELARSYTNIGQTYSIISNYNKASNFLYKSLEIYDSLNLSTRVASNLDALASIDTHLKDYPAAIKKVSKAIELHKKNKMIVSSLLSTLNLANVYCHMHEWEKAISHCDEAIPLLKELTEYDQLIYAYALKADALKEIDQLELAQQSIKKALELKAYTNNPVYLLGMYHKQGELFVLTEDYAQSITSFTMVLDSAKKISNLNLQIAALEGLIVSYKASNNFKQAFEYSSELLIANDSLTTRTNQQNIKDIEIKYETEKKEQENQLLLKEKELQAKDLATNKQRLYVSIGFAFLIFIISILVLRQYRANAKATNNALKSRLLRNQMSPHFLFNSLVAIQSFVYTNNPIKAGDYLSSFATLMRAILDNSSKEYITLKKELAWLENYLSLQLLRFKDKFEYQVDVEEHIQMDNTLIPPMLIQPFIENALEHGLKNLNKKGLIVINIQQQNDQLSITVKDNGLGMTNNATSTNKTHESRALSITKERLSFLNKNKLKR